MLAIACIAGFGAREARAVDGTWIGGSSDWADPTNWTSNPNVPDGTAMFGNTGSSSVDSASFVVISAIQFTSAPNAQAFTINNNADIFAIVGTGIVNSSTNTQTFNVFGDGLIFINGSTANGGTGAVGINNSSSLTFQDTSTAGTATIMNSSVLQMMGSSTAGAAAITNTNNASFADNSTAGTATINNSGTGTLSFSTNSSVQGATIINNGILTFSNLSNAGTAGTAGITNNNMLDFFDSSSAGVATIGNTATMTFHATSNAGSATITNAASGTLDFNDTSSAQAATITNNGAMQFNNGSAAGTAGITNNSTLNFNDGSSADHAVIGNNAALSFNATSTAANANITNAAAGTLTFNTSSTAQAATIVNNGSVQFNDSSTAGTATITNNNSLGFFSSSTAAGANITNAAAGTLTFNDTSSAQASTIINSGTLQFNNTSTAGTAAITNNATITLADTSTANSATITYNANSASVSFLGNSSAGNAVIQSATGITGSNTSFSDNSTAGSATIRNAPLGFVQFTNTASAGSAMIFNTGSQTLGAATTSFGLTSTAGSATITNSFGTTTFNDQSTAGTATIVNNAGGSTVFGSFGGTASADHAIITNEAGSGGLGSGGITKFMGSTTADSAIITTRSGGGVAFFGTSSGAAARFVTDAGGIFDISQLTSAGTTAASIEGAGTYYLGSKQLTVGSNNLSTVVSGVISDGSCGCFGAGGTGGSLVKVGSGTLTLAGANTYTGATAVQAGTLLLTGSLASNATTVSNGAALQGTGTTTGAVTILNGGQIAPGLAGTNNGIGTLTVGALALNTGAAFNVDLSAPNIIGGTTNDLIVSNGALTLGGTVNINALSGFGAGAYRLINYSGALTDNGLTVNGLPTGTNGFVQAVGGQVNLLIAGANGVTQYWNGATTAANGMLNGGTGSWTNANANWTDQAGNFTERWVSGTGIFAGTAGTVSVNDTIAFQALRFATTGYTIAAGSGTLTATGIASVTADAGVTATIAASIGGSAGLTKSGAGTLALSGTSTYTGNTVISAGTLQIGNGATTGTVGAGNIANSGVLAFNRSNLLTIANTISGTGAVNQIGSGTTVLTAANTYSGPTTISAGQLTIAAGASIASNVTNNAAFVNAGSVGGAVANAGTMTNSGAITGGLSNSGGSTSNSGSIAQGIVVSGGSFTQSSGSVSGGLTNAATVNANGGALNGAIANTAGTFNVGGTVTSNSTFGNASGATLAIGGSGNYTLAGLFSNGGALAVASGGVFDASAGGISNLPGGTIVVATGGTVRDDLANAGAVTNNGLYVANIASNSGSIANTGTWTGNVASSTGSIANAGTWTGAISTSGSFTNAPGASVSGLLSVTGGTALNNGALNGGVLVTGGTLTGSGSVAGTTVASGTFAPGSGAGSFMTVAGNLSLTSGVQYVVALNPSTASFVNATGTATLGGATVNATYADGTYISKRYTILNAAGGVAGTFGGPVNTNLPANFKASLAYDATHAYLDLALNFTPPVFMPLNVNQGNVAATLVNYFNRTGGIPLAFGALSPAGLTQVSGETATGSQQTTFDAMNQFLGLLTDPFVAGRNAPAAAAFADDGQANAYAGERRRSGAERDTYGMITKAVPQPIFAQRWNVWAAGFGGSKTTAGNAALGAGTATGGIYGGAVGADYWFSPQTVTGFALAGGGTQFSVANAGSGRSDLFQAGAFIRHTNGPAYITGALAYGWQDITTERTVTAAGLDRLRAQFNANAYSGRIEGGYRFAHPWLALTPYAAGQFTAFELPSYAETVVGANTFALAYAGRSVTASRSELGLRSDKSWALGDGMFTLRGRAAWAHDFNTDRNVQATFQTLPGASFVVNGAPAARNAALTTGSAEWTFASGLALAATFEGEFSDVTRGYAGKGVVRYAW